MTKHYRAIRAIDRLPETDSEQMVRLIDGGGFSFIDKDECVPSADGVFWFEPYEPQKLVEIKDVEAAAKGIYECETRPIDYKWDNLDISNKIRYIQRAKAAITAMGFSICNSFG